MPVFEYGFRSQGPLLLLAATTASSVFLGVRASVTLFALLLLVIVASSVLFSPPALVPASTSTSTRTP